MKRLLVFVAVFVLSVGFVLNGAGYLPPAKKLKKTEIFIPVGSSARKVSSILQKSGIARNESVLTYYLSYAGIADKLKSGHYVFYQDSNIKEISETLRQGPVLTSKWITIPEGWTIKKIAERIAGKGELDKKQFESMVNDPGYFSTYPFLKDRAITSLEGYLFPQTYKIDLNTTTEAFIKLMLNQFEMEATKLNWSVVPAKKLTKREIIIIASLIEREARVPAERPLVASVIYNRLAINMPLQIDATVQYALPDWKDRLLFKDLKVKSPYNTYTNKGLPPGPICNPGIASIKAALTPAPTRYLYYVLKDDNGNHHFAETYSEFLAAKRRRK